MSAAFGQRVAASNPPPESKQAMVISRQMCSVVTTRSFGFGLRLLVLDLGKAIVRLPSVNAQNTSAEPTPDLQLEIAHVLLTDVVGLFETARERAD